MIKCLSWPVGVCTWSLGNDFAKIGALVEQTKVGHVHLAVSPLLGKDAAAYRAKLEDSALEITATMIDFPQEDYSTLDAIKATGGIVPDANWEANRQRAFDAIDMTARLGVRLLTTHFGFIDMKNPTAAEKLIGRVKTLADRAAQKGVTLLMETGQETAEELAEFLEKANHPVLAVNFDPANMILYDKGDPVEAVKTLAPWVEHIHIKDAVRTQKAGTWGSEVPWGTGQVGGARFLKALRLIGFGGALAVEREAGDDRLGDIKSAISMLTGFKG